MRQVHAAHRLAPAAVLGFFWLAFYAAWLVVSPGGERGMTIFSNTAYQVPIVAATVLAVYAWRRGPLGLRPFWALLAAANAIWLGAEILWATRELTTGSVPFPWWTDAGYLASYALMPVALRAAFRPTLRTVRAKTLLDAVLVVGSLALLWWLVVLEPLPLGLDLASAVGLAYPLFGLLMIGMLVSTRLLPARRGNLALALVAIGIGVAGFSDALYTHAAITHSYLPGDWIALGWQAEAVLFALAGYVSARGIDVNAQWARFRDPISLTGGIVGGTLAALLVAFGYAAATGTAPLALFVAGGALALLLVARIGLALRAADPSPHVDAETGAQEADALDEHLRLLAARARHFGEPFGLVLVERDGDADAALDAEAARLLVGAAHEVDVVVRVTPGRAAVLVANADADATFDRAEEWRAALAQESRLRSPVTVSVGIDAWAGPGDTPSSVLARTEAALAAARRLGGNQVRRARDLNALAAGDARPQRFELLLTLAESVAVREGGDVRHPHNVASLARSLAVALELDEAAVTRTYVAGLFHDIGKVSVPDFVLTKATAPDAQEWLELEAHPRRGADLIAAVPELRDAAPIVAAHHERWDGTGYPSQLAGESVPREARILAVADTFVAMTSPRRHRRPLSVTNALTEIWRYAGERFDAGVVSALLALGREGRLGVDEPAPRRSVTLSH